MNRLAAYFTGASLVLAFIYLTAGRAEASYNLPDPYAWTPVNAEPDTIPLTERYGNCLEDTLRNPFDLFDPEEIVRDVEYDPITNSYIITERIGDEVY